MFIARKYSDATTSLVPKAYTDIFDPSIQNDSKIAAQAKSDSLLRAHQTLQIAFGSEIGHFLTQKRDMPHRTRPKSPR
jgi:hypothetical protein